MKTKSFLQKHPWLTGAAVMALAVVLAAGCKNQQPAQEAGARTDQQVASDIQAKIQGETALAGQNIQVSVNGGVATLSGTVSDDASRALAGNDSGTVNGIKTVVNNLTVQPAQQASAAPAPAPVTERQAKPARGRRDRAEVAPPPQMAPPPPSAAQQVPAPPPPPPPPPMPVVRQITLAAGTVVPVKLTEALDSKTAQTNDVFHASLAQDLMAQGVVAIPHGAPVLGRIVEAREAAHFKGNSLLAIELTQLTARGQKVTLVTDTYSQAGAGRGKNTAEKAGGGAVVGALIGALAGGGKGAAIGAVAGGGAGAGINAATRGQQVQIPSETLLNFQLQSPITLTVTISPSGNTQNDQNGDPQLLHR